MSELLYFLIILFSLLEIELGKVKSFPQLNSISDEKLKTLKELKDFEYDVSLVGRKISVQDEINLNSYGKF